MAILKFEDIFAWQKSQDLAVEIYQVFQNSKDYGFKDQITRASVSISNNIAEGFDRKSNADFSKFLYYALSSCSEVKSMVYLGQRLNYLTQEQKDTFVASTQEISRLINGLIKSLQEKK